MGYINVYKKNNSILCFFFFILLHTRFISAQKLPEISDLSHKNILFKQFSEEVEKNYRLLAQGNTSISLQFFYYRAEKNDTLLTIAARSLIPYETLASLNRLGEVGANIEGKLLILPTCPGLFILEKPFSPLEILLKEKYLHEPNLVCYTLGDNLFYFIQDARLSGTERAFFLDSNLRLPVFHAVLSSNYGQRLSPITGKSSFHEGVDLAAPEGSLVMACKSGQIEQTGYSEIYGNFIIIKHEDEKGRQMRSFYAHLKTIDCKEASFVLGGATIGSVGSTGLSTGPHLHFEIWLNGKTIDPNDLIKGIR